MTSSKLLQCWRFDIKTFPEVGLSREASAACDIVRILTF